MWKPEKFPWKLEKFRWRNLFLQNPLGPVKLHFCSLTLILSRPLCAVLGCSEGKCHLDVALNYGTVSRKAAAGAKVLHPVPHPLPPWAIAAETLPGLHSPGSAPSYSSPPGNPLSGDRTWLVVAFGLLSGIFPGLVSGLWCSLLCLRYQLMYLSTAQRWSLDPLNSYWSDFSCWFCSLVAPYCISGWNGQASSDLSVVSPARPSWTPA